MINSLHLRNFKGIRRADVGLERLTVIVGPNASGKTSFLEALLSLSRLNAVDPRKRFRGRRDPLLIYSRNAKGEEMELSCRGAEGAIRVRVVPPETFPEDMLHPRQTPVAWTFHVEGQEAGETPDSWHSIDLIPAVARAFRSAELLQHDASNMGSSPEHPKSRIKPNGQGVAMALVFMALNQPDDFQILQERLQTIIPTLERIRFDRAETKFSGVHLKTRESLSTMFPDLFPNPEKTITWTIIFDFKEASDIPAHLASEGTLLVLGLLTVLMSPVRPNLILLDDLDHALHPKAQREVVALLRTVLDQNPELQIVATTHSPYLVDNLRPEEVRLTTLGEDGTVSIAGLVDHPDFEKWKDEMAPGEMWSLFGEKWVSEVAKNPEVE